jgi:hypothetical protein
MTDDDSDPENTSPAENVQYVKSLWEPHPGQAAVMNLNVRFKILSAGRRWGKSLLAAHVAFREALENDDATVWWVAPSYDQANEFGFDKIKELLSPDVLEDTKRTKPRKLELKNGSTLSFRSAEREDSLRGPGLDFLVIDEAGSVPRRAWVEELRPALADTQGGMLAIGTPRGRNWFFEWYERGQSADHRNTASVRAPTTQNPHVADEEIEAAKEQMPERVFKQEHLAEFVDSTGGVFDGVRDAVAEYSLPIPAADASGPFAMGVDFARFDDYTVMIVLDTEGQLVAFDRVNETTWHRIQSKITDLAEEYSPAHVAVDATRDNKIVGDLEAEGIDVQAVNFGSQKQRIIDNLALSLEAGELTLSADAPELVNELEVFEYNITDSGNVKYSAPSGFKDDTVDALALAVEALEEAAGSEAATGMVSLGGDSRDTDPEGSTARGGGLDAAAKRIGSKRDKWNTTGKW